MRETPEAKRFRRDVLSSMTIREVESRSWRLRNVERHEYWHTVTFTPGVLMISGDLGELVLIHPHAFTRWKDAAWWLRRNDDVDYLLSKSSAAKDYDVEATCANLFAIADEDIWWLIRDYRLHGVDRADFFRRQVENSVWRRLAAGFVVYRPISFSRMRRVTRAAIRDHLNDHGPEMAIQLAIEAEIDDFRPSMRYPWQALMQAAALREWATKVVGPTDLVLRGLPLMG